VADIRTPAAWLSVLEARLDERWARPRTGMGILDAYYEGDHRLAFATAKFREAFGNLFGAIADNWMPLVVEAKVERLEVQGFRFGSETTADTLAWDMWQANGMDEGSDLVHTEAVKLGEAYWLVEPPARGSSDPPRITYEHPSQVIVACAPGDPRQRLAALKKWVGEDGYAYANVYTPNSIAKFRSQERPRIGQAIQWSRRSDDPGGEHDLGVPIIPIRNNPSMLHGGRSDMAVALPLQDALNKLLSDMLVGSEYQAFPQRVLLGVEVPRDPNTGQPVAAAQLQASQSRLWTFENENAKVTEFKAADLSAYVSSREHIAQGLNAKTRVPPHYTLGEMVNVTGDALTAAEAGLVSKVRRAMRPFGESHEEALRIGFLAMGDTERAAIVDSETIWRNPEWRSQAQAVDAGAKLAAIGVPEEVVWEQCGFSPQQIARMKALKLVDQAFGAEDIAPPPADAAPVA
jgi:hypothetical protein